MIGNNRKAGCAQKPAAKDPARLTRSYHITGEIFLRLPMIQT